LCSTPTPGSRGSSSPSCSSTGCVTRLVPPHTHATRSCDAPPSAAPATDPPPLTEYSLVHGGAGGRAVLADGAECASGGRHGDPRRRQALARAVLHKRPSASHPGPTRSLPTARDRPQPASRGRELLPCGTHARCHFRVALLATVCTHPRRSDCMQKRVAKVAGLSVGDLNQLERVCPAVHARLPPSLRPAHSPRRPSMFHLVADVCHCPRVVHALDTPATTTHTRTYVCAYTHTGVPVAAGVRPRVHP
jgi:hypothetical protein